MIATAIKFIRYDRAKSIGVIIGIVISIFLIGQQLGILGFLTSLMGGLVDNSREDIAQIWVTDNITENANELAKLDARLPREIRSLEGVLNAWPVVVTGSNIKFANGKTAPVQLVGSEPPLFVAGPRPDRINAGTLEGLTMESGISAEFFDSTVFNNSVALGTRVELNGKEAFIRVQTRNVRGFGGTVQYTSLSRARYYGNFPDDKISAVAVQVKPGYSTDQVLRNINNTIYGIRAWDTRKLKNTTIRFITVTSNIGTSIGSLVVFAIISGFFIIGLTLYSAALDRVKDYGTLKAIGATNGYVRNLILTQALLFALIGFGLAWLLLEGFRRSVAASGLIIELSGPIVAGLFVVTLLISVGGSLFAIGRINSVEPASVFRG